MYYPDQLEAMGVGISALGLPIFRGAPIPNCTLQWFSGQSDQNKVPLFEGDICKIAVQNEFGSATEGLAIMRWTPEIRQFILHIVNSVPNLQVKISSCIRIGDELRNPELSKPING